MRQIFRPAIGLMSRLTYPQKFVVISLLFVLPLAASLTLLFGRIDSDLDFTRKELDGTAYLARCTRCFNTPSRSNSWPRSSSAATRPPSRLCWTSTPS